MLKSNSTPSMVMKTETGSDQRDTCQSAEAAVQ
jgi:hypothetical protein